VNSLYASFHSYLLQLHLPCSQPQEPWAQEQLALPQLFYKQDEDVSEKECEICNRIMPG
jgi:hypothetical protein